jgi:hypothetical protein
VLLTTRVGVAGLLVALTAGLTAPAAVAGSPEDRRAVVAKPTLKSTQTAVVTRNQLTLSGKVKPAKKGTLVILQKLQQGKKKWTTEARLRTTRTGGFRYVDVPKAVGVRHYRVVVPKAGKVKLGVSKPVKVTVYRWQSLTQVNLRASNATAVVKKVLINGTTYGTTSGLVGYTDYYQQGFADWNLNRACRQLQVRVGNSDDSDDHAVANISLVGDGESMYAKSFGLAQSEWVTLDLRGVFRFGFHWTSTNPDGTPEDQSGAAAALAGPQILCAF